MIASVEVAEIRPAATLVTVRSIPALPTLTVEAGFVPAKLCVTPLIVAEGVATAAAVSEPLPIATALSLATFVLLPRAKPLAPVTVALLPRTIPLSAEIVELLPTT